MKLLIIGKINKEEYMLKNCFLLIVLIIMTLNAFGQEIRPISKGEVAQFDGFLIDSSMEKKMRAYKEESKKLQEINIELKSLGELQEIRHESYKKNNEDLTTENNRLQTQKSLNGLLYFFLGAVITGGISYGVIKTLK